MIVGFIVGLMVGGCLATIVISLLVAGSRAEDARYGEHTCNPKCEPLAGLHRGQW